MIGCAVLGAAMHLQLLFCCSASHSFRLIGEFSHGTESGEDIQYSSFTLSFRRGISTFHMSIKNPSAGDVEAITDGFTQIIRTLHLLSGDAPSGIREIGTFRQLSSDKIPGCLHHDVRYC